MKKDSYYFPHFYNARTDRKIKRVIKDLGIEGYGIYFMILEVLREQTDFKYPLDDIDLLADEFGCSEVKLKAVVSKYDLFKADKGMFTSPKLILYLQPYLERSKRAQAAANKRWKKVNNDLSKQPKQLAQNANVDANAYANALPEQCVSECKESKVKESKEYTAQIETAATVPVVQQVPSFGDFRNLYSNRKNRKGCEYLWNRLTDEEKIKIVSVVPTYIKYAEAMNYTQLRFPKKWLRERSWEDEYSIPEKKNAAPSPKYKDLIL